MQFIWNEWLHCENPKMSAHYCSGLCVSVCCSFRCFCIEPQIGLASSCHCCQFPNGYTFLFHCKHFVHFILGFLILSISSRFSQAVPKELLAKFSSFRCTYDPSWTQCTLVFNVSGFFLPAYIFWCCVSSRSPHLICKHINLRRNSFFFSPSLSVFVCVCVWMWKERYTVFNVMINDALSYDAIMKFCVYRFWFDCVNLNCLAQSRF